jgi:hypothetical protein
MDDPAGKIFRGRCRKRLWEPICRLEATPRLSGVTPIFEMRMGSTVLIMASVSSAWALLNDEAIFVARAEPGFERDAFCLYGKPDRYRWTHP